MREARGHDPQGDNVIAHSFASHASEGFIAANENDDLIREGENKQCILETQLICYDGNKNATYLAMLARVGLDSPTKSVESRDSSNQSNEMQERERMATNVSSQSKGDIPIQSRQYCLSPRKGWIGKDKGKSPLGRR